MSDLNLKVGCFRYDHTRALVDGTVKIDGVNASFHSAPHRLGDLRANGPAARVRRLGTRDDVLSPDPRPRGSAVHRAPDFPESQFPTLGDLHQHVEWHQDAARSRGQDHRRIRDSTGTMRESGRRASCRTSMA